MPAVSRHDPVLASLSRYLGECREGGAGEWCFCSPFRDRFRNPKKSDRGFHLYVNVPKGSWIDFKSGLSGSISYLFILLGEEMPDRPPPQVTSLDLLRDALHALDRPISPPVVELPDFYQPVCGGSPVYYYLRGRGLTDEEIVGYRIGEGKEEMSNVVILPSFRRDGACDFWLTRRIDRDDGMKYRNPKGVPRRLHVGLIDVAVNYSPRHVNICEGYFSAIIAGRDSVCTFGKIVSDAQLDILVAHGITMVTVALDGDVDAGTILDVADRSLRRGLRTRIVWMPARQDPADIGREHFQALRDQAREVGPEDVVRERLARLA